jgi:hypothetical protein
MPASETGIIAAEEPEPKPAKSVRLDTVFEDFNNEDYSEED